MKHKCRHSYCPNHYDDVIGADGWGGVRSGAECVPCMYANQMFDQGTTPEKVESVPQLMDQFASLLEKTGWTWQHVKDSFERVSAGARIER